MMMPAMRVKMEFGPLVNEILDQLPPDVWTSDTTTFLDPAFGGGQFLREIERRLREAGHSEDNISNRVYGCEIRQIRINWTWDHGGVKTRNLIKTDFVSYDGWGDMKFDVIVGNPPYQEDKNTGGNLWLKFVDKCVRDLSKGGTMFGFITPPTFIGRSAATSSRSDYGCYHELDIQTLSFLDKTQAQTYFPGIGSRFCWYVANKSQQVTTLTKIKQGEFEDQVNLKTSYPLPDDVNEMSMGIHQKLIASPGMTFKQTREIKYFGLKNLSQVQDNKDKTYKYKSYFSHNLVRYTSIKASHYSSLKVMIPQTSTVDKSFIDKNCNISEDLFYYEASSVQEADQVLKHVNSDVVKYVCKNYRGGRAMGQALKSGIIPAMNNKIKFTAQEIKYIKEMIT